MLRGILWGNELGMKPGACFAGKCGAQLLRLGSIQITAPSIAQATLNSVSLSVLHNVYATLSTRPESRRQNRKIRDYEGNSRLRMVCQVCSCNYDAVQP